MFTMVEITISSCFYLYLYVDMKMNFAHLLTSGMYRIHPYHNDAILFKNNVLQGDNVGFVSTVTLHLAVMAKNKYKGFCLGFSKSLIGLRKPEVSWQLCILATLSGLQETEKPCIAICSS